MGPHHNHGNHDLNKLELTLPRDAFAQVTTFLACRFLRRFLIWTEDILRQIDKLTQASKHGHLNGGDSSYYTNGDTVLQMDLMSTWFTLTPTYNSTWFLKFACIKCTCLIHLFFFTSVSPRVGDWSWIWWHYFEKWCSWL